MALNGYSVRFQVRPSYARYVRTRSLSALARRVLAAERLRPPAGLSVVITNDADVRSLNRRYLGHDRATDVLSFPLQPGDGFVLPRGAPRQLGEIVISYPTASRQARLARHSVHDELAHLLVHGVLHILGYDHERPAEAKRMRAREDALLGRRVH